MKSAYITFDNIDLNSGAGKVCYHEIQALQRVTELEKVIARTDPKLPNIKSAGMESAGRYEFNPYLMTILLRKKLPA